MFPDHAARDYDERIVRLVPGYALAIELMSCVLAERLCGRCRVLVPGCGTGAEILAFARRLPQARFTALDPSAGMLNAAREKVAAAGLADRVTFVCGRLEELPKEQHDAASLSLVLHFLPDDGAKLTLLREIGGRLATGAPLLLFDAIESGVGDDVLSSWLCSQGHAHAAVSATLKRITTDWHRIVPERMDQLLSEADFSGEQILFRALGFRLTVAERLALNRL
ncbi:class I SAM-dependent methyltransferase [Mesorhizobium plurifarium]|uniref:class I SAM-dependent methyltransferase n=1 Tax=Sinorhizobium arboris TaxID=76745 RepID=UPI0004846476|nr:class I SAM-dependent methyltransferase [Sinorhizobium arboris]PST20586.1 class I SAM-dependent methyltransferase [Mesorhizobium plurifarium]